MRIIATNKPVDTLAIIMAAINPVDIAIDVALISICILG